MASYFFRFFFRFFFSLCSFLLTFAVMDKEVYSGYANEDNPVGDCMDGYQETERHGNTRLGRLIRHGQVWFTKSYDFGFGLAEAELRLHKEYETLLRLNHQGIVRAGWLENIPDVGLCLVMEFIEGETLDKFLNHASKSERKKIAVALIQTVAFIHSKNICHLDLKPQNIMVTGHDDMVSIKIIDFGMSDWEGNALFKHPGGSLGYSDPAQFAADYKAIPQSDVYSLGKLIHLINPGRLYERVAREALNPIPAQRPKDAAAMIDKVRHYGKLQKRLALAGYGLILICVTSAILLTLNKDAGDRQVAGRSDGKVAETSIDSAYNLKPVAENIASTDNTGHEAAVANAETGNTDLSQSRTQDVETTEDKEEEKDVWATEKQEYERIVKEWKKELNLRTKEMEKIASDTSIPPEERKRTVKQMYASLYQETLSFFTPHFNRQEEYIRQYKPVSWCSFYDSTYDTIRRRMGEIYMSIE